MEEKKILETAIRVFGESAQEEKAIEELAELICAIAHKHCGRDANISEEIADVEIMLEQLKIINNCHEEVNGIKYHKLMRLQEKIFDKCL